jgi:hypothetical protein
MMIRGILIPLFVQVALTFVLLFWSGLRGADWRSAAAEPHASFRSQFELPVLFYVLVALLIIARHADLVFLLLAWVFVVLRIIDAGVFVTNAAGTGRGVFLASAVVLVVMWALFAVEVLLLI